VAEEVAIRGSGAVAKLRNPVGVLLLGIITLGIYHLYWWYAINREMADLGRARGTDRLGDSPVMSLLAVTLGAIVLIPAIVSFWRTCKRVETAQELELGDNNFSPVLMVVLTILVITSFLVGPLMQSNLNQVWRREAGS
jgi:hypothetical protein